MSTKIVDRYRRHVLDLEALAQNPHELLTALAKQHEQLRFATFDVQASWQLGVTLREVGVAERLPIAIDITLGLQTVFHAALPGSSADNDAWARRKAAVADRYLESSLAVGVRFDRDHGGFDVSSRLPVMDYAAHGGALPLLLTSGVHLGHVAVSGLPQLQDHALVVSALETLLHAQSAGAV